MRYPILAISVWALAAVVVAADPPKLGPEWTYDMNMKEYKKTMSIKVTRPSAGVSGQGYYLDLQHDKMLIQDTDENTSTGVRVNDTLSLEIDKRRKGKPNSVSIVVNKCGYVDIDSDGVWDIWWDSRGTNHKCFIRSIEAWVQVADSKGGVSGDYPALSYDRKTEYTWDGFVWKGRSVDR